MPPRFHRIGLVAQLLLAIFADLRRRAWWAYRAGSSRPVRPPIARVERHAAETERRPPLVTPAWRPLADRALPVQRSARVVLPSGEECAVVWIDVRERPEIADLPRVLDSGPRASSVTPVAATQWLFDPPAGAVVLIASIVDPVTATVPIRFVLPNQRQLLELVVDAAHLCVAFGTPPNLPHPPALPLVEPPAIRPGLMLPITSTVQLRHILWASDPATDN